MHVKRLAAADAPAYRRLLLEAYTVDADAFTSTAGERAAEPEDFWVRRIADPAGGSAGFGAFDGTVLVGAVALEFSAKPKTRHKALVVGMYLQPAARGRGAAWALMQALLAHARERDGLRLLTLTATAGNEAALGLYRRCGFRVFGVEPMAILTPSGYKAKVHMWLPLHGEGAVPAPGDAGPHTSIDP